MYSGHCPAVDAEWARKAVYQPRRILSQMHMMNYYAFRTRKGDLLEKNSEPIGGPFTALSPLNPPLLLPTALCWQAKNYNLENFKRNFVPAQFASFFLKSNLYKMLKCRGITLLANNIGAILAQYRHIGSRLANITILGQCWCDIVVPM